MDGQIYLIQVIDSVTFLTLPLSSAVFAVLRGAAVAVEAYQLTSQQLGHGWER